MKKIVSAAFLVLLVAGNALGQLDQGPDGIGIYFDEGATSVSHDSDGTSGVSAYLILTNPAASGELVFWDAYVWPDDQLTESVFITGEPRFGSNAAQPMPGVQGYPFSVTNEAPMLPTLEPIVVLADLTIYLGGYLQPVGLHIGGYAVYSLSEFVDWQDDNLVILNPSSGGWNLPVAMINGPAPVAVESRTWGGLRALFRD